MADSVGFIPGDSGNLEVLLKTLSRIYPVILDRYRPQSPHGYPKILHESPQISHWKPIRFPSKPTNLLKSCYWNKQNPPTRPQIQKIHDLVGIPQSISHEHPHNIPSLPSQDKKSTHLFGLKICVIGAFRLDIHLCLLEYWFWCWIHFSCFIVSK